MKAAWFTDAQKAFVLSDIRQTQVRYGYRHLHVLLERENWGTNIKQTYRICWGWACKGTSSTTTSKSVPLNVGSSHHIIVMVLVN